MCRLVLQMLFQAAQAFGDGNARLVAEIAAGSVVAEPVRCRKLAHQKPRERRFALASRQVVDQFQETRGRESQRSADRAPYRRKARRVEQSIDDLPERNELALSDEI